jgi:O-antigen/teichoic acid export membrane protein
MSKFEKYNGMVLVISIVINIALNFALTPRWGMNGTAFASGFSIVVWNVALFFIIKRKTGLRAWVFRPGRH